MSTRTEQEIKIKQRGCENHGETDRKCKIPVFYKRNALVEIGNINKNQAINIQNSLKVNCKIKTKPSVNVNNKVGVKKKLNEDKIKNDNSMKNSEENRLKNINVINNKVNTNKLNEDKIKNDSSTKKFEKNILKNIKNIDVINNKVVKKKLNEDEIKNDNSTKKSKENILKNIDVVNNKIIKKKLNEDKVKNDNSMKKSEENILKNIENIDVYYRNNLFLVSQYAEDIYNHLRQLELKYRIKKWPLNSNVNEEMRATLVDWLVEIHLEYDLLQETLHLAVSLVDRYLQISNDVTVKNLQLVGVCCMALATKYEEVLPLSVSDFLYLCNNAYKKCEFLNMEIAILKGIDFQMARPLTIYFLRRYSLASKADRRQHVCAKYLLDLALLDASLCHVRPSLLAACAFFIATCLVNDKFDPNYWTEQLIFYSKYEYESIRIYTSKLSKLVLDNAKYLKTVKKKYSAKEFDSVSNKIHTKTQLLNAFSEGEPHGK